MMILHEFPFRQEPVQALVTPVSPRRFLELALQDGLDARVPWEIAWKLCQLLEVPFPVHNDRPVENLPTEFLVARVKDGHLQLYHVVINTL